MTLKQVALTLTVVTNCRAVIELFSEVGLCPREVATEELLVVSEKQKKKKIIETIK